MRPSALVLLSGGLDSLASLHWASQNADLALGLTINYGHKAFAKECEAAQNICKKYDISHQVMDLTWLGGFGHNALVDPKVLLPKLHRADLDDEKLVQESAQIVWVPNRNGLFINAAASLAENEMISWIVMGFNKEEAKTFPDNSSGFVDAVNKSLSFSTQKKVSVVAPHVEKNKKEIVSWLLKAGGDLTHLWSCYEGSKKMCGECESCQRLMRPLDEAGAHEWKSQFF